MTMQEINTEIESNQSNPHFQLGYLSGTCKGAIGELERFIEHFSEELSETQIYCINQTIDTINRGLKTMGFEPTK
jgi:hypothetical protein